MLKIGYQGVSGAYSEIAALTYFDGEDMDRIGYDTFVEIFEDVQNGTLDYAVLPVENTTTGIIARTYDLFRNYDIHVVGEVDVAIYHNLIVIPGTKKEEIREVYSHPEALLQCGSFFRNNPQMKDITYTDTAKAVQYVKECNDPSKAALASWLAADHYGMEILERSVQDLRTNATRFLVVTKRDEVVEGADKISLMVILKHTPGALYNALGILAKNDINITRLESRPIQGKMFEYLFYIDVTGNLNDEHVKEALNELHDSCEECRIFGNYKAATF